MRVPAAQAGPRPRRPGWMSQAVPVPTENRESAEQAVDTVRRLRALATPAGTSALARAGELLTARTDAVTALSRLRAEVGVDLAGPAWGVARQREKARPVF